MNFYGFRLPAEAKLGTEKPISRDDAPIGAMFSIWKPSQMCCIGIYL